MNIKATINAFLICNFLLINPVNLFAAENYDQAVVPVSLELAKFVSVDHAKQFYGDMGELEFYDSEIYYDLDGNPAVYAIILASSEVIVPSREELKTKIASKYSDIESLRQEITAIKNQPISGKEKSEKIQDIRTQILQARRELAGTEEFVTVICGADESYSPILKLFKGLPKHLTQKPFLLNKSEVRSSVKGEVIRRTFYLGMFDLAFEFGVPETTRQVQSASQVRKAVPKAEVNLIHSRTGKILIIGKLRQFRAEKKIRVSDESLPEDASKSNIQYRSRKEALNKKWQRIKQRWEQQRREKEISKPTFDAKSKDTED